MAAELKPYPAYKDSGVEWLGEVPAYWDVRQLGRVGRFFKGAGGTKEDDRKGGVPCIRYGDLYTHHRFFITKSRASVASETAAAGYTSLRHGDVLFAGSGETIDEIGTSAVHLIPGPACCGGDVIIFRPSIEVDARFLGYAADCPQAAYQKACMGRGITVMHIYASELKYLTVALPPLAEQAAIVRFLVHADRRIRRYIRAKEKLIALLAEQKQAVLQEALTGQADVQTGRPYRAYKPCSVGGLGDVPEDWDVVRLSRVIRSGPKNGVSPPADEHGALASFAISAVRNGSVDVWDTDKKSISRDGIAVDAYNLLADDILLVRGNGNLRLVGRAGLVERDMPGWIYPDLLMRLRLTDAAVPRFVVALLHLPAARNQVESSARTAVGTFKINSHDVRQLWLALPAVPEQLRILAHVSEWTRPLVHLGNQATRSVELMREYRTRLIADVVTGKLNALEAATGLPELESLAAEEDPDDDFNRRPGAEASGDAEVGGPVADGVDAERRDAAAAESMAEGR